ncbi:hypothetical protein QYF61_018811 [Mycteria americana]|uniref:Uncharacterized protein n=1 Tax=Mycteria americana TaxID=33587 RepID=A0AAN7NIQ6_MYCAM|nr:hypothetical protein QYF61_018811 [Mycteria americana]
MAEQEVCGAQQLEVPRQRFRRRRELGPIRGHSPATAPPDSGAAMAAASTAGPEGRGRTASAAQGRRASLSQRVQELRSIIALQASAASSLANSHVPIQVAQEKLRAEIFDRVNTCNMLLYQMRQRSQAQHEMQRRLQQLQDAQMDDKQHQAQVQVIRQLENNIEKMLTKVHAGQKVTALYLAVRNVLRKELAHLPLHLDLLCRTAELYHRELEDMELMALDALKAADVTKEDMAEMETQFLAERELRYRSLAAQKVHIDRLWLKEASERHLRAQARYELIADFPTLHLQDPLVGAKLEATKSQMEHEALVTEKMEKAKAAVQCSRLWDIPGRLLAQQKSSVDLEQYVKECKEKKQALKEMLKELELKQAELKFSQPPNTTRCCWPRDSRANQTTTHGGGHVHHGCMDVNVVGSRMLEEDLRMNLRWEEARLEQMRAQMLRNQELLLNFENGIDNLFIRLRGITVPGQDDSVKARRVEEKLQHCEQKLQYLVQRVADLPPHRHSPDEDNEVHGGSVPAVVFGDPDGDLPDGPSQAMLPAGRMETFVKVRNFLEKTTANDPQNLKISLEDLGSRVQDPFDFADKDHGLVLTREEIKKQGLHLIESKKKSGKKK